MILAFRHKDSPRRTFQAKPRGLKAGATYRVARSDEQRRQTTTTMSAGDLGSILLQIDEPRASLLVRYKPLNPTHE
jgi:hypothetical protein